MFLPDGPTQVRNYTWSASPGQQRSGVNDGCVSAVNRRPMGDVHVQEKRILIQVGLVDLAPPLCTRSELPLSGGALHSGLIKIPRPAEKTPLKS